MTEIRVGGGALDLPASFSMEIEDTNPVFNEVGSQSLPATVPATPRNRRLLSFPDMLTAAAHPNQPARTAEVADGALLRRGTLNITSAGRREGISFNIGFDNSTAYAAWQGKKLAELSTLPIIHGHNFVSNLLDLARRVYEGREEEHPELAVFPAALACEKSSDGGAEREYWEVANVPASDGSFNQPEKVKRLVDGKVTEVSVPAGYGVTPFLRVWKLLELAFADLGVVIEENPFRSDADLERLVVLNNTVDGVASGVIRYSELVPDCTVAELMNALWARFGLTYVVNADKGTATLRFIRDIMADDPATDLTEAATAPELVSFPSPQYVKLSASTSFDGAEPPCERFEDFAGDLEGRPILQGFDIEKWFDIGASEIEAGKWLEPSGVRDSAEIIGCEIVSGRWYRLDTANRLIRKSGSSFFNWDPAPEGLEAFELASDDECVPMVKASTVVTNAGDVLTGNLFEGFCPGYLAGARHRHSIIKGSATTEADAEADEETPLAFMFAYTAGGRTVGRPSPEGIVMDEGVAAPRLTLFFQFEDGLFANFWAAYDEFLRHGNRTVEFPARLPKTRLALDMARPVCYRGARCLVDTLSYSLPAPTMVPVDVKLRVIQPQGSYDISREQGVPPYALSGGSLNWIEVSSDRDTVPADTASLFGTAIAHAVELYPGYASPVYDESRNEWRFFAAGGCRISGRRVVTDWNTDGDLPAPTSELLALSRSYEVGVLVEVYLVTTFGEKDRPEDEWMLSDEPYYSHWYSVPYSVALAARWVRG